MRNKFLLAVILLTLTAFGANAQSATPRYGTSSTSDNTGRVLTWGTITKTDTLGATPDTVTTLFQDGSGRSFYNIDVVFNLKDSAVFSFKALTGFHFGDRATIYISNASGSGHWLQFLGYSGQTTGWAMATTGTKISPASAGWAILRFWCDAVGIWHEVSRDVH